MAFGAVGYIRIKYVTGEVVCSLVMAKVRLAPLKTLTIPQLEVQSAVLSVRLSNFILKETGLKFDSASYWVDSTLVLQYIYNESKGFKVFVGNRIAEIRESSERCQQSGDIQMGSQILLMLLHMV